MSQKKRSRETRVATLPHKDALAEVRPKALFRRFLFSFFVVSVILTVIYVSTPISRLGIVYFNGLNTLTRSELISLIDIGEDELFLSIRLSEIQRNVEQHPIVSQADVTRVWLNRIRIEVIEYEVAACMLVEGEMFHILTDGVLLHENVGMRVNCDEMMIDGLTQKEIDADVPGLFVRQLMRVDSEIVDLIQMIEHAPLYNDIHRFSISLIDGNIIKVTTHTMAEQLNFYWQILARLEEREPGQTGVLHLDVGKIFVPHE